MTQTVKRRLVMIVDNHVEGDSRVQKMAESCAAGDFDVTLVGRSRDTQRHTWNIGEATVVLIPAPLNLLGYGATHPGRSIRWPLAYPSKEADVHASIVNRQRKAIHAERVALVKLASKSGGASLWSRLAVKLSSLYTQGRHGVYALRHRQYGTANAHRKTEPSGIDRLRAKFIRLARGRNAWRYLDPTLVDFELGMAPYIEQLKPDLIHAHDFRMVGIGVRVAERRRSIGKQCAVVYDAHEYMPGVHARNLSWRLANEQHEAIYAPRADAVVTVSGELATMLQTRHHLTTLPTVALNAPSANEPAAKTHEGIRHSCGLGPDTPLMVYIGSPAPQRGLMTIVESLKDLGDVHAAVVLPPNTPLAEPLVARAQELGVHDRFHVLPYVPPAEVVSYIREANVGVIPIHHQLNHEISLITKYFDYVHADLPIVVSDVKEMSKVTREQGNGEVFTAESTPEFVAAVRKVLTNPDEYTSVYTPELKYSWSWEAQADRLIGLYDSLIPSAVQQDEAETN